MLRQIFRSFIHSKSIKTRPISRGVSSHKPKLDIKDIPESEIYWELQPETGAYDKLNVNPFAALLTNLAILSIFAGSMSFFKTYWPLGYYNKAPEVPEIDFESGENADKQDNWKRSSREQHDEEKHDGEKHGHH